MPTSTPSYTAIVVTHDSALTIARCLNSLQSNHAAAIIVVDNASEDTTRDVVRRHAVTLRTQADNRGFGAACNIGAQHVETDFLLFLNPDAYLAPHALAAAGAYCQTHPRVGVAGFQLRNSAGQPQTDNFGDEITLRTLFQRKVSAAAYVPTTPVNCGWVSGGAMLVRREVWEKVTGFDEQYFLYWEDVDFCKRVRTAGYQVVFLPQAVAMHERGHSLGDLRRKTALYDLSADRYFCAHYAGWICLLQHYLRRLFRFFSPQVR